MGNYNITMKQYDGVNYNTLYPKSISQQILLNDNTIATLIGISILNPTLADVIQQLQTNIIGTTEIGTYVGTGQYGSGNPNSLTFSFAPKVVIIGAQTSVPIFMIMINGMSNSASTNSPSSSVTITWNNKICSWYSVDDANAQFNTSGTTYYYVAIQ